jgi:hypothetical protein
VKKFLLALLFLIVSCDSEKGEDFSKSKAQDEALIKREIADYHRALKKAYNGTPMNTDSVIDHYFDRDVYYVTYWGTSEPIDSTKKRLRAALPRIKNYDNQYENLTVKVYGDGAYAFFILRQDYTIDGHLLEEYLPTTFVMERRGERWVVVHAQRSADLQSIQQLMQLAKLREQETQQTHK